MANPFSDDSIRYIHPERRHYKRIHKSFILTYYEVANPSQKNEITQLKNVSLGGMCFVTTRAFPSGTKLHVGLKTPYLAGTTHLEGEVLESREKAKDMLYETRLKFSTLTHEANYLLTKMIDFFINEPDKEK